MTHIAYGGANYDTPEGGRAFTLFNRTGGTISAGEMVELSSSAARAFRRAVAGAANPCGVSYETVNDGEECWVVTDGLANVWLDASGGCTTGQVLGMSPTEPGRVRAGLDGVPVGWALSSAGASTQVLAVVRTAPTNAQWDTVTAYGAKGDGVTDDTAAFQAAIVASNGETLYVPPGTYVIDNLPVVVPTHLHLDDAATLLHKPNGSVAMIAFNSSELTIEGGTVNGNRLNNTLNWPVIIGGTLEYGRTIKLTNVKFTGTMAAIVYTWNFGGVLEMQHCTITDQQESDGLAIHRTTIINIGSGQAGVKGLVRYNFNRAVATVPASIDGASPGGVIIATCVGAVVNPGNFSTLEFIGNEFYGYGQNMDANNISPLHLYKDVGGARIIGNYFEQCAQPAIHGKSVMDFVCTDNVILNGQTTSAQISSEGAIAYDPGYFAGLVSHPRAVISGNIIDSPGAQITNAASAILETGDVGGEMSGYENMTGLVSQNTNAGVLYISVVDDGAGFFHADFYKDAARTQLVAHTATYNGVGAKALTADGASGLGGTVTIDAVGPAQDFTVQCLAKLHGISVRGIPTSTATDVVVADNVISNCGIGIFGTEIGDLNIRGGHIRGSTGGALGREGCIQLYGVVGNVLIEGVHIYSANGYGLYCADGTSPTARFSVSNCYFEHSAAGYYACTLRGVAYAGFFGNVFNAPGLTAVSISWDGVTPTALLHWDGGNSVLAGSLVFDWAHITAGTGYLIGAASPYGVVPAGAIGTLYQQTTGAQLWIANVASVTGWSRVVACWMGSTTPSLGTINANTVVTFTIAVAGAKVGLSSCAVASPVGTPGAGLVWSAHVTADDVVTVRVANPTLGNIVTSDVLWVASVSVLV